MRLGDALSLLVERADVIEAAGRTFLLMEVPPYLMDFLASYRADREDMEDSGDDEPDYDNERDYRLAPKTLSRAKEVDGIVWVGERPAS